MRKLDTPFGFCQEFAQNICGNALLYPVQDLHEWGEWQMRCLIAAPGQYMRIAG
ncbi:MAG TPA: hypothetical protein VGG72_08980 [Bryobacteraceae bacterium]